MWSLQTPAIGSPKLLDVLCDQANDSVRGGAAFAFATAAGIKLLSADARFKKGLDAGKFTMVVGLDAITDDAALDALKALKTTHPNLEPLAFLHTTAGSLFHPKTAWFRRSVGGSIVTGSGNLTTGGLRSNWEAAAVVNYGNADIDAAEGSWTDWLAAHAAQLLAIDDPTAVARAKLNKARKIKIRKALQLPADEELPDEVVADGEAAVLEANLTPVLIAEVPKSGDRWKQVNFDVATYQGFFGVTLGVDKDVEFRQVRPDGTLGEVEQRHAVAVKSLNYRFEVGAAQGLDYPAEGNPILVFEKVTDSYFKYALLMPGDARHTVMQNYLNDNYTRGSGKLRVVVSMDVLEKVWPDAPFFK
jgi:hypothetical protein